MAAHISWSDLVDALRGCMRGKTFTLSPGTLEALDPWLKDYLGGALEIRKADLTVHETQPGLRSPALADSGGSVVVVGQSASLTRDAARPLHAVFELRADADGLGVPAMTLTATVSDDRWTLGDTLVGLPDGWLAAVHTSGQGGSVFLSTETQPAPSWIGTLTPGWGFDLELALPDGATALAPFFGKAGTARFRGTGARWHDGSEVRLRATGNEASHLGLLSGGLTLCLCADGIPLGPDDGYVEVYHALEGALELPVDRGTPLPVRGVWGLWTGAVTLVLDGTQAVPATWKALEQLVGGAGLKRLVDAYDVFDHNLSLAGLSVTVGLTPPFVEAVELSVVFGRWEIADDVLVLDPVEVGFSVVSPLDGPQVQFWVAAVAHVFEDDFEMQVAAVFPGWELAGELVKPVPIDSLLGHLHVPLPDPTTVPGLRGLTCARLNLHANPKYHSYAGYAWFTSDWELHVADTLTLSFDSLALAVRGQVLGESPSINTAFVEGRLHVASVPVDARYEFGSELDVKAGPVEEGPLADIPLGKLVGDLLQHEGLDFGTLPSVDLKRLSLGVRYASPRLELWASTDVVAGELGAAHVDVTVFEDEGLGFVAALAMPGDWRLSDLGADFADLAFLAIDDTTIQIAATPKPGEATELDADLSTTLALEGGHGLGKLGSILSYAGTKVDLALAAHVPLTDPMGSSLDARLKAHELWLIPTVLRFDDLRLDIALRPLQLTVATDFLLRFSDTDEVALSGGATLTDDSISLFLVAKATKEHPLLDWPDPLGVAHLTLRGIGLELTVEQPEGLAVTLSGQFRIGTEDDPGYPPVELAAAAKVAWEVGEDPPFPAGIYTEKVSEQPIVLGQLLQELVTPDGFPGQRSVYDEVLSLFDKISIDAFAMVIAVEGDWTIPEFGRTFPQGFSFLGVFDCYGIHADLRLQIDTSASADHSVPGFEGSAEISPIAISAAGHTVVSISGYGGQGDPLLRLSTWSSPWLKVSGDLKLLDTIESEIEAVVDTTKGLYAFHFCHTLESAVGGQIQIHCKLDGYTSFDACSDFSYHVDKVVHPKVDTRWGSLDLGSIDVSGDGTASVHISASLDEGLSWTVSLDLSFAGEALPLPSIRSDVYVASIHDIMAQMVDQLESLDWSWFRSSGGGMSVDDLIALFEAEVLQIYRTGDAEISTICKILYDEYDRDLVEAVADLRALRFEVWEIVVMAWDAYAPNADALVSAVTQAFGASPEVVQQIVDGLQRVGYDWKLVYPTLNGLGIPIEWYLERLRGVYGVSYDVLGPYLKDLFGKDRAFDLLVDWAKYPVDKVEEWVEKVWDWLPDWLPDWPLLGATVAGAEPARAWDREATEALLNEKAWADPAFRARLLSTDPSVVRETIGAFLDTSIPPSVTITVVQEEPDVYWHVVPYLEGGTAGVQPPQLWPRPRFAARVNWLAKHELGFLEQFEKGGAEARKALREAANLALPDGLDVRVARETPDTYTLVLHDPAHDRGWKGPFLLRFGDAAVTVPASEAFAADEWTLAMTLLVDGDGLRGDGFRPVFRVGGDGPALGVACGALALELTVNGTRRRVVPNQATTVALEAGRLCTVSASLVDGRVSLTIDGVLVARETLGGRCERSRGPVVFGGRGEGSFHGAVARASFFAARVDRVGLWRHLRTPHPSAPTPDGLVASWPLVRGYGARLVDVSGGDHHGVIEGATWTQALPRR